MERVSYLGKHMGTRGPPWKLRRPYQAVPNPAVLSNAMTSSDINTFPYSALCIFQIPLPSTTMLLPDDYTHMRGMMTFTCHLCLVGDDIGTMMIRKGIEDNNDCKGELNTETSEWFWNTKDYGRRIHNNPLRQRRILCPIYNFSRRKIQGERQLLDTHNPRKPPGGGMTSQLLGPLSQSANSPAAIVQSLTHCIPKVSGINRAKFSYASLLA